MHALSARERHILGKLRTPKGIQDFLESIPINFEKNGETCMSPRRVLQERKAHCLEGALLAAAALQVNGAPPLLVNLKSADPDVDHVLALFKRAGYWGAITKTNHSVLRYREPIYRNVRELALSYFHEYIWDDGRKMLRSYSRPLNLSRFDDRHWMTSEEDLWYVSDALDDEPHYNLLPFSPKELRRADPIELKALDLEQYPGA